MRLAPRPWPLALGLIALLAAPSPAQIAPDKAMATFTTGEGMQVSLFASEPMLLNPTAIDIDPFGRVWVAEAVNYRRVNFKRPIIREEGDRIVILTDADGDGKADTSTVFYQGKELYGPLSVLVLPLPGAKHPKACRVLVAQSPDILEFVDADGDGKADGPPAKFLTNFGGFDHDHGVHGLTTGPDGKIYFTVGDEGVKGLQSKDGKGRKFVTSRDPKSDCQAGTVWRVDLDGNNLELVAHNFRNNYEACVDSFGEIWLSDNDDDGNQQTRICHVMPGGNYGYWPRGQGQSHWHEEQPGIVHKTLRTGFGSPTGIAFYEGNLFPKLNGQLLHCDAGPREVRAFKRKPKGAGYELDKTLLLTSTDNWFRPSDVCVAPDGSIFVADWYDPGVGGHGMGDWTRGRIYRLTPKGSTGYKVPALELGTKEGVLAALGSPATSARAAAHQRLAVMNVKEAADVLGAGLLGPNGAEFMARIEGGKGISLADREKFRVDPLITARVKAELVPLRRRGGGEHLPVVSPLPDEATQDRLVEQGMRLAVYSSIPRHTAAALGDEVKIRPEPGRPARAREALLAMAKLDLQGEDYFYAVFYYLAKLYDGQDIFYRAALNIACGTDPARRDAILDRFPSNFPEWNDKVADLVWELRPKSMLPKLGELMNDAKLTAAQKGRIVEILAASDDVSAGKSMLGLLGGDQPAAVKAKALEQLKLFLPGKWAKLGESAEFKAAVEKLLGQANPAAGLQLVSAAKLSGFRDPVAKIAADAKQPAEVRTEAIATLGTFKDQAAVSALQPLLNDPAVAKAAAVALAQQIVGKGDTPASKQALAALEKLMTAADTPPALRQAGVAALAGTRAGTGYLLQLKQDGKFPEALTADAGRLLRNSPFQGERNKAYQLFPAPGKLDPKALPASNALAQRVGDVANGQKILAKSGTSEVQCMKCHMVRGQGGQIGPDLSLIGKKGSKENLHDSILYPSKAIADQYASWVITTDDGQSLTGLIVGETETTLTLRDANGTDYQLPLKGIESRKKSLVSLMPEGLVSTLSEDELVDLVEYLATLQTAALTPQAWQLSGPFPAANAAAIDGAFAVKSAKSVRPNAAGYVDLAALHGANSANSVSLLSVVIESPVEQAATILIGTDDGCRLSVNGAEVLSHDRGEAATPGRDAVKVKLLKGANTVALKIHNGSNPHGFYFNVLSEQELKAK